MKKVYATSYKLHQDHTSARFIVILVVEVAVIFQFNDLAVPVIAHIFIRTVLLKLGSWLALVEKLDSQDCPPLVRIQVDDT
jgi:hypothetical protein